MKRFLRAICAALLLAPSLAFAADDPLAGVGELIFAGRGTEARAKLAAAREAYAAQSNRTGEAVALLLLGMADLSLSDAAAARANFRQATETFTSLGDHFGAWLSLWTLSELEKSEGQLDAAIAVHERALELLRKAADPASRFSLETTKVLGPVFGMPTDSLGPLAEHPEIIKPILLKFAEVISRDAYGSLLTRAGQYEKAEEQLTQAMSAATLFGGLFDASIAAHVGDLRRQQWRLDEARDSYKKALDGVKALPGVWFRDAWVEVEIVGKMAELEVLSGRVDEGLAWNDRGRKLVRDSGNGKRVAAIVEARADLLKLAGRFDEAINVYTDALKLASDHGDASREASVHASLGSLHMMQGTYGAALRHLEKAIALYQTLGQPYLEAPVWAVLAEVYMLVNTHEGADFALDNAKALAKKSNFKLAEAMVEMLRTGNSYIKGQASAGEVERALRLWWELPEARSLIFNEDAQRALRNAMRFDGTIIASPDPEQIKTPGPSVLTSMTLMLRGKMLLERGEYEAARKQWLQALAANPNRDHRAGLHGLIAASYWREGKREEAIRHMTRAAEAVDASATDVRVEELLTNYLGSSERPSYYDILIDMLVSTQRPAEAFAQAERARARAFLQLIGNHRFNVERSADPRLAREAEILRTQIAEQERSAKEAPADEAKGIASALEGARQRYRTLMIRVKTSNPEYAAMTAVEPLQIDEVRQELPSDATLISYYVASNVVHAWVIDRERLQYATLPLDAAGLRRIVAWAARFGPPDDARGVRVPAREFDAATAEEAFDKLIAPLLKEIRHGKLVLVPHGVLHYVPFAALRNRETGRYLIEDYTITFAPSASAIRFLRAKETPVGGGALVLGDPVSPLPKLRKLPGAEQEARSIAAKLRTAPHLGTQATETLLYGLGGTVDLVHLAAHGIYDSSNPIFSRMALAEGGVHDGSLTVHEILSSVDLTGVNLVVLSACRSAAGARSGGDEVVGLTRAILYAGTPGVISTLWNIDDDASSALMGTFYGRLVTGASAAEALQQAQIALIRSERHGDPKYWAAFTLSGDPQGRWNHAEQTP